MKAKILLTTGLLGFIILLFSCKSNNEAIESNIDVDSYSSTSNDTIPAHPEYPENPVNPGWPDECVNAKFSEAELSKIAFLIDLIPTIIITDFNIKYLEWKKTWSRPEIALSSGARKSAESDEYYSLLEFSAKYGDAILPLIFIKLYEKVHHDSYLLEDLSLPKYQNVYDDVMAAQCPPHNILPPTIYAWIKFSKRLLEEEYDNILLSIQKLSE